MFEFFKKLKANERIRKLIHASDETVYNDDVDTFFTHSVLLLRLPGAIRPYIETLITVYNLFNNKTKKFCHTKDMYISERGDHLFVNIIFRMHDGNVTLTFFHIPGMTVEDQYNMLNHILSGTEGFFYSADVLSNEVFPEPAGTIVKGMTYPGNDADKIRLRKIRRENDELVFHQLNIRNGDVEGITVLGGFTVLTT
jgi:hypothetical protein